MHWIGCDIRLKSVDLCTNMKLTHCIVPTTRWSGRVLHRWNYGTPSNLLASYIHPQTDFHNGPFYACLPTCLNIPHFTSSHFRLPKSSHTQSGSWKFVIFGPQKRIWILKNMLPLSPDTCKILVLFKRIVFSPQTLDHFIAKQFGTQPINRSCKLSGKAIQPIHYWSINYLGVE